MSRSAWLAASRRRTEELVGLAINGIVPSRRDFTQFLSSQRSELAVVPRLKRSDPFTGGSWPAQDFSTLARLLDDSEVGALAVCPSACFGGEPADIDSVSVSATAPLLCDDLILSDLQIYDARLRGADAVRIALPELATDEVERLADVAVSLHVSPVIEVGTLADLQRAPLRAPNVVGIDCRREDAFADVEAIAEIAAQVPRHLVCLSLTEVAAAVQARELCGIVDAVIVGDALLNAPDPIALVDEVLG